MVLAMGFVFLAVMLFISLIAVLFRHAIPRAPGLFQTLVGVPTVVAIVVSILLAYMTLDGDGALWGVGLGAYRAALVYALALMFASLNVYSFYFYVAGRYRGN